MMYRYFADATGTIVARAEFETTCFFNQTDIWVDNEQDLDMSEWKIDTVNLVLIKK